jgi:hypothetical protein
MWFEISFQPLRICWFMVIVRRSSEELISQSSRFEVVVLETQRPHVGLDANKVYVIELMSLVLLTSGFACRLEVFICLLSR